MKRFLVLLVPIVALTVVASACTTSSSSTSGPEVVEVGASGGGVAVVPAEESPSGLTVNVTGRTTMPSSQVFVIVVPEPGRLRPLPGRADIKRQGTDQGQRPGARHTGRGHRFSKRTDLLAIRLPCPSTGRR